MAPGPLLEGRETRLADGMTVIHLVLLQKPAANQQPDATSPISTGATMITPREGRSRRRRARTVDVGSWVM